MSGDHITGFTPQKMYIAEGGYIITEEFVGARESIPVLKSMKEQKIKQKGLDIGTYIL